jgi:hypothetical protein
MTYLSNPSEVGAYETPIGLRSFTPSVLQGFMQTARSPGSLVSVRFDLGWQQSNMHSPGSGMGNTMPMFPPLNILNPIATNFNVDLPGSDAENPGVSSFDVLTTGSPTIDWITRSPSTGDVDLTVNGTGFADDVNALIAAGGGPTPFTGVTGNTGNHDAADTSNELNLNGDDSYITTDASGSDVDFTFKRPLFEKFSDGSTAVTTTGTSLDQTLLFEASNSGTNHTGTPLGVVADNSANKITFSLNTSLLSLGYNTVNTDSGNVSGGGTLKVTNISDAGIKPSLEITGNEASAPDELRFKMVPDPKVGFGSQLVVVVETIGDASFDVVYNGGPNPNTDTIRYKKYACAVLTFDPTNGNVSCAAAYNGSNVRQQELWDFSLNSTYDSGADDIRTNPDCGSIGRGSAPLVSDLVNPAGSVEKFTYVALQCGEVLLAQKTGKTDPVTGADVYVIGMTSNLKVHCT